MAVKRRPRLQSNTNILLACLAATDALTGLATQPALIVWKSLDLLNGIDGTVVQDFHKFFLRALTVCSSLHLILITCERLIAVIFTISYLYIVTKRKVKVAVIVFWVFSFTSQGLNYISNNAVVIVTTNLLISVTMTFCIFFIAATYAILYRETRRQENKIKTQQLPQEEVERFAKESKALKTTVFVVSAVIVSFLPMALTLLVLQGRKRQEKYKAMFAVSVPLTRTCAILNSLLNPLIYCLRQREMRKFVFRVPCKPVESAMS